MKKYIALLFLTSFVALGVNAQFGKAFQMPVVAGDTITNTGTSTKYITCTAGYDAIAIQPVVTKTSGTMAGTIAVYGSLNGTNYVSIGDTMNVAETNLTKIFTHTSTPYVSYKIVQTGVGTMVARWKVWYVLRKKITTTQ